MIMKAKKLKKMLSLMMAMSMVASMPTFALAAEEEAAAKGGATGDGGVEFVYNENVFQVVLPVESADDTRLDFILDPMQVIKETANQTGQKKLDENAEDATMLFPNVGEDGAVTYSNISDAYDITNKSTFGITVTVDAKIVDPTVLQAEDGETAAKFVEELTEDGAEDAEIVLALQVSDDEVDDVAIGDDFAAQLTFEIEAKEDAYKLVYDEKTGEYTYDVDPDIAGQEDAFADQTRSITMTGECNQHDDWNKLGDINPSVEVTWTITAGTEDAEITDFDNRNSGSTSTKGLTLKVGDNTAQTVTVAIPEGATDIDTAVAMVGETKLSTFKASYVDIAEGGLSISGTGIGKLTTKAQVVTITVTFDGSDEEVTFIITVTE